MAEEMEMKNGNESFYRNKNGLFILEYKGKINGCNFYALVDEFSKEKYDVFVRIKHNGINIEKERSFPSSAEATRYVESIRMGIEGLVLGEDVKDLIGI